ncbi:MAG TPA: ATP-dependent RecD-like DNA helicase [Verrucomicrobiae bacterium]|nr:ATP-dependent RecD-like DNA helicase [Verrucomicrobiae bacterium]
MNDASMADASSQNLESIEGTLERIIYSNEENHYTVAQLLPEGRHRAELITITGNLAAINEGETVKALGRWVNHKQFGRQFAVEKFESVLPRTIVGIKKYLGSGLIKGIGDTFADRIVDKFGERTFEVIDSFSARLREVDGIGPERARRIKEAWSAQKSVRDIMIFLQGHGIGSAHAAKIYKQYGEHAIAVVRENPYRLANDIAGIGFRTADGIASKLGIAKDSIHRLKAGVVHTLERATDDGHVCLPHEHLVSAARELLETEMAPVESAVDLLVVGGEVIQEEGFVYLARLHKSERGVAAKIQELLAAPITLPSIDLEKALVWVQQKTKVDLAAAQQHAIQSALTSKISIITGGPGVGKTTIVNSIVKILQAKNSKVLLAAPTGRAAKRMTEATGAPAQTIHRLLKYEPHAGGFTHNERRPLQGDMIIIDETSMLDIPLAYHLLRAIPPTASVVFVGDVDQLPSVGPGNFLRDVIDSNRLPVVRLTEIFRQARNSLIVTNAHRVNQGQTPVTTASGTLAPPKVDSGVTVSVADVPDFFFIEEEAPEQVLATIKTLCAQRVPKKFGFDPMRDIQVLTPMHKGLCGSENLNRELQATLNPTGPHVQRFGRTYRVGDRVMQIRNNYDKDVFNGDLGRIKRIDLVEQQVIVEMENAGAPSGSSFREIPYEFTDMDEMLPAYAISVHKSQGNEYPCVIAPLLTQHFVLLQRNLLYTAITRGKKLVILIGSKKALAIAVRNNKTAARFSRLRERLCEVKNQN